ncbi:MAG: TraR/DksA family transcriptional regulator [Gammaproteobacteria bacterium]|jgi:RNA polymerase-binding protein DksA
MQSPDKYRQKLLDLRDQYNKKIGAIDADVHHKNEPVEKDFAEQATQRENDDVLNALNEDAKIIVGQINSALHRIESGDYGICTECGAEISEGRLDIVPYAALCIKCAEKSD